MSRRLIFTVDLDRDVNTPVKGYAAAGSMDRGSGTEPRFSSTGKGLMMLLDLLDDIGVRATFFVEGRTSEVIDCSSIFGHCIGFHGYQHEDLLGQDTGVGVDCEDVLTRGFHAVSDNIARPVCFRAPYMRADEHILEIVSGLGIRHDSSVYRRPEEGLDSYSTVGGMLEHPVPISKDSRGKAIFAYLWPMHEGRRGPEDYITMADSLECDDFILATHTWHMVESYDRGMMSDECVESNMENLRSVLEGIVDSGRTPATMV